MDSSTQARTTATHPWLSGVQERVVRHLQPSEDESLLQTLHRWHHVARVIYVRDSDLFTFDALSVTLASVFTLALLAIHRQPSLIALLYSALNMWVPHALMISLMAFMGLLFTASRPCVFHPLYAETVVFYKTRAYMSFVLATLFGLLVLAEAYLPDVTDALTGHRANGDVERKFVRYAMPAFVLGVFTGGPLAAAFLARQCMAAIRLFRLPPLAARRSYAQSDNAQPEY